MNTIKSSILTFDKEPHAHEEDILAALSSGNAEAGEAAKAARAIGITWAAIFALIVQYGPQFVTIIQAIIEALKTQIPRPMGESPAKAEEVPEQAAEEHKHRGRKHAHE
jgi:hypothetical protein